MRGAVLTCLIAGVCLLTGYGDFVQATGPRESAKGLFAAIERGAWDSAATFIDSGDVEPFRQRALTMLLVQVSRRDSTRTGGMAVINDPATELHNVYGRTRLASFRGQGTVADILALSSQEFLAGGLQITQKELYPALSGGLAVHAHRIITKAQFLDDSTASISYSIMVKPRGASIIPGVMELRMSKRGKRWYAVPTDELVSPLRIVDYLTGGVRGS